MPRWTWLSHTHYNECPQLYNIFLSFWRHATILPQRNHFLHDLITRVFLRSLQCGIVVLGFLDAFVYAHHKHRQDSENWKFWWLHEREDSLYDGQHSCLRRRVPGNVSCSTLTWHPAPKPPAAQAQIQTSVSSQCSFHNTWKRQWLSWVGYLYRWWYSRFCWWTLAGWGVISRSPRGRINVWSRRHHRGSSRFVWCSLQQHCRNDCHDWSIVFSWSLWPCGSGWAVVHLLRFSAAGVLLGHDPGSHTCATGTRVSKIHDFRSTQTSTHHATRVLSQC